MYTFDEFTGVVRAALGESAAVPLLVLRLPEFAEIAWRDGKRAARNVERRTTVAFRSAAAQVVRDGDALAHTCGSDRFAIAMLAPSRRGRCPGSGEIRTTLERIATAMSLSTGRCMETGWWALEAPAELDAFAHTLDVALERGARERDRHELFATVGHELRTPLTSIRGYIETLLDGEELDARTTRRFLETARREALRLGRLVEGMLEFSLLDLSAPHMAGYCDVAEQIRATIDAAVPLARERGVRIRAKLPRSAPARIDGDACVHALLNLVENALKHGSDAGTIEITCEREGPFIRVAVEDDGPGIAPVEREAIFGMRIRGEAARRPGTGIGLAVVKAVVERAGGDVRVTSSALGGASFVVRFRADRKMEA
ncbi:MAG TPA: HAMP domain-containing sensor histidine kinase [Candidatus Baltobacteraceae bacterium]|nr:HAMP domain-containing sensor histidine kinase [Candidatus Baltobacteraceae bacterium]